MSRLIAHLLKNGHASQHMWRQLRNQGVSSHDSADARPHLAPRAWLPLVFVVIALVLLFATPLIVGHRVQHVRNDQFDVADQARVVVNDFEAAFATELIALRANRGNAAASDSATASTIKMERLQERALDSLAGRLGPEAVERVVVLRAAEQQWRAANYKAGRSSPEAGGDGQNGLNVLSSAESLDDYLLQVSNVARARVAQLERINVYSAAALAPIALIAVAIVFLLDRRMRAFAGEADDRARKLQHSVELREALIRGVTHDIKNPLGAASGYAELLEEGIAGPLTAQQAEMIRRFKQLVVTAQHTVTELLDLARVGGEELVIDARDTELVGTVREVVNGYEAAATRKGVALAMNASVGTLVLKTDPGRVRHVVENLVSNAIKYTPSGGSVHVSITLEGDEATGESVSISVRDTGPGIAPEFRERIFEEFFRVPSTDHIASGSGLGLAISRRIARLLGGDITFSDAPGRGSIFSLKLPVSGAPSQVSGNDSTAARDRTLTLA
jgi:signal transduction histidine kinase